MLSTSTKNIRTANPDEQGGPPERANEPDSKWNVTCARRVTSDVCRLTVYVRFALERARE